MPDSTQKPFQRIVVIVSGLALLTTMTVAGFSFQRSPSSEPNNATGNVSRDEQLQSIVQGYEAVLAREPDNPTARQGLEEALRALVATQIQAQNLEKAIPPMEKLAELVPDNSEYQTILKQMKQAKNNPPAPPPSSEPVPINPDLNLTPPNLNPSPDNDPLNLNPQASPDPLNLNQESNSNPFDFGTEPNTDTN